MATRKGLYPNARATITAQLAKPVERGAIAAEDKLRDNLGQTSGGQGVQYPQLPNRSSAPGQDPRKQSGAMQDDVGREKVSDTRQRVGMFPKTAEDAKKYRTLEYGYDPNNLEGRGYLQRWADDPETKREMLEAATRRS